MTTRAFTANPFQTVTYVVSVDGEAAIIDASPDSPSALRPITEYIDAEGLRVRHLLLTHAHIDHVYACAALSDRYALPWQMHIDDLVLWRHAQDQARFLGVPPIPRMPDEPKSFLRDGDVVPLGSRAFTVLHTPGHSPGSVSFIDQAGGAAFTGDVLFRGSIGRYDLLGASLPVLMQSLNRLLDLPDVLRVYPGHGPDTTIGFERQHNPYLQ